MIQNNTPLCACGCEQQVERSSRSVNSWNKFIHGHHAKGRKKSLDEKRRIGEKNTINMKRYMKAHPDVAKKRNEQMLQAHTPEMTERRIEATKHAYASMTLEEKETFSVHAKKLWSENREMMDEAHHKASETFKDRSAAGEYDFETRNANLSKSITQKYLDGGFAWSKGEYTSTKTFKKIYYRSAWELQYAQKLDSDENVSSWEYEFDALPYMLDESQRHYVPDFLVTYVDNHQEFVEIKPQALRETKMNQAKRDVAHAYCLQRNIQYVEWAP